MLEATALGKYRICKSLEHDAIARRTRKGPNDLV